MKKYTLYLIAVTVVVVLLNLYFNFSIYRNQVSFQRSILSGQAEACVAELEEAIMKFENEVNALLYSRSLLDVDITSDDINQPGLRNLEMLFSNNHELIRNIHLYDKSNNVLNLTFNKRNKLLVDPYVTQLSYALVNKETFTKGEEHYQLAFPVFKNDELVANLVFTLNITDFISSYFNQRFHDEAFFQWIIDRNGNVLFTNAPVKPAFSDSVALKDRITGEQTGFFKHKVQFAGKKENLYSAFSPLALLQEKFSVVYSMRERFVFDLVLNKVIVSAIFSTLIMLLMLLLMLGKLGKNLVLKEKASNETANLQSVIDNLPVGIMVLDQQHQVRILNKTARDMLLMKEEEIKAGGKITDRFMLSKDYYNNGNDTSFDSNQFVLYRHEGEEVAVMKKDLPFELNQEELILSAFVDVTPIEKARKYEAASNTAKSEFLAKMSHEIRTPMNGIIGMTEALDQENLTPNQKEYVQIVKRSADVLLTLIDDILDFSKIEAGKMQLEEIPFKLREEVKFSIDLFKPIIEEKKLTLSFKVSPNVPENIIGDPFRLRQVLSNLISNAVKFTSEGEIAVGVELEEEYNNNVTLLFYVEDTGVGIPRNKIETIFNSFTQAEDSTSRRFGGTGLGTTIAKQLVTLMHGEIWVQSPSTLSRKPEHPGSRFSFTIEVYSNEKLPKALPVNNIKQFSQINAIIVSHTENSRPRLTRLFDMNKINYEVFVLDNSRPEALRLKLDDPSFPVHLLVVLDEQELDGISLVKTLHDYKLTDRMLVYLISANHKPANYVLSKRYGVDYYFSEPFEQSDLTAGFHESFPLLEKVSHESVRKIRPDLSILLAEDNEINIRVAQTIFTSIGYNIDVARNGKEAVDKVKNKPYDIVFMDLVMPEMDGLQATIEIRGSGQQLPIIAMTATASSKSKSRAISTGMNDYIVKPVKTDVIRNILLKWFA